jgi:enoyl-CoA hydratase/carnithine racemase
MEPDPLHGLPASLEYRRDGDIAVVHLARVAKRNALDDETVRGIETLFRNLPDDVRAVVVSARGDHFSAGLDLSSLTATTSLDSLRRSHMWYRAFDLIQYGNVPVIVALHGAVIGGGLELAAAAHIRVADATAYYALPEAQRGIFVGGGGSVRIARLIGFARMQDMMLTGRVLKPDEAERYGAVQYVVPKGESLAKARELAAAICKNAPLTNFAVTNSLPRLQDLSYDDGIYFERMVAEYTRSPESIDRVNQFLDKSAPRMSMPD